MIIMMCFTNCMYVITTDWSHFLRSKLGWHIFLSFKMAQVITADDAQGAGLIQQFQVI